MKIFLKYIILFFIVGCISSQTTTQRQTNPNRIEEKKFYPRVNFFHFHPDSTLMYLSVSSKDLLYIRSDAANDFSAQLKVHYRILDEQTKIPVDTGTLIVNDVGLSEHKTIVAQKKLALTSFKNYFAELKFIDVNRDEKLNTHVFINKKNLFSSQYFMVLNENKTPNFEVSTNEKNIWLAHPTYANNTLWVRFYNRDFRIPPPPFSDNRLEKFSYKADSVFKIQLNDSGYVFVELPQSGFLHFQRDSSQKDGFTFFNFIGGFPEVTKVEQLIEPIRYLSSKDEFQKITSATNKKTAVDEFWLNLCGSKERAKEVIRQYYGRVELANKKYSSYLEGWKTDRGMIAIIFGEPHSVTQSGDSEIWYYNNERAYSYMSFTFLKINNPFTDNDYMLTRDQGYKPQWYRAVESWRQGRAYNANNF